MRTVARCPFCGTVVGCELDFDVVFLDPHDTSDVGGPCGSRIILGEHKGKAAIEAVTGSA